MLARSPVKSMEACVGLATAAVAGIRGWAGSILGHPTRRPNRASQVSYSAHSQLELFAMSGQCGRGACCCLAWFVCFL